MKVEIHLNGSIQIQLMPEGALEEQVLCEMVERAEKGKIVVLDRLDAAGACVSVER